MSSTKSVPCINNSCTDNTMASSYKIEIVTATTTFVTYKFTFTFIYTTMKPITHVGRRCVTVLHPSREYEKHKLR